jgi:16S rRNA (uracil1498-N3)-methyltransferase
MPRYDFRTPRIYVDAALRSGAALALNVPQTHYLRHVLRLKLGDEVLVFNGCDGEWLATLGLVDKHALSLVVGERTRAQTPALGLHYLFAPLKHARLDYMVQKAVELGASRLQPVLTQHSQVARVNLDRMKANAIEAAEQCGILSLPETAPPVTLEAMVAARDPARLLIFCDEDAAVTDPLAALIPQRRPEPQPLAVLVGPEGGFAEHERSMLLGLPNVVRISLGPRILRADTAAVAALALVGAALGDWR